MTSVKKVSFLEEIRGFTELQTIKTPLNLLEYTLSNLRGVQVLFIFTC